LILAGHGVSLRVEAGTLLVASVIESVAFF
jgi:hypothetical protein